MDVTEGLLCFLKDRTTIFCQQVLWEVSHTYTIRHVDLTPSRLTGAREDLKECTLTRSVLSHQRNAILGINNEGYI